MTTSKMDTRASTLMEFSGSLLMDITLWPSTAGKILSIWKKLSNTFNHNPLDSSKSTKPILTRSGPNGHKKKSVGSTFRMDKEERKL
jgi:hypothetical protein